MSTVYPTRQLGRNGPTVSAMGLGAMGKLQKSRVPSSSHLHPTGLGGLFYGGADENSVLEMLTRAANCGVTFWDTADAYGDSEETIGKWFKKTGRRSEFFYQPSLEERTSRKIQPSHVKKRIASSLSLLDPNPHGAEKASRSKSYIDLYFQHRVDPDTPIEGMHLLGLHLEECL
ncbi:NADP-dependent oxidoreductase domain-containing protein [Mycena latifolia]|nr:NADP-dependent oxidoreductase domain-containing protein [Mycena latifolia]